MVGSYPTSLLPLFMKTPRRIAAEERPFSFVERGLDGLCDRYIGKANVSEAKSVNAMASGAFEAFFGTFMCQVLCLAGARRKRKGYVSVTQIPKLCYCTKRST